MHAQLCRLSINFTGLSQIVPDLWLLWRIRFFYIPDVAVYLFSCAEERLFLAEHRRVINKSINQSVYESVIQ